MIWLYNYEYDCTIRIRIPNPLHVASLYQATTRRGGMLSWIGLFPLLYVYSLWPLFAKEIWWLHQLCGMAAPFTTCYNYMLRPDSQPRTRFEAGQPISKPVNRLRSGSRMNRQSGENWRCFVIGTWSTGQMHRRIADRANRRSKLQIRRLRYAPTYIFNSWPYILVLFEMKKPFLGSDRLST